MSLAAVAPAGPGARRRVSVVVATLLLVAGCSIDGPTADAGLVAVLLEAEDVPGYVALEPTFDEPDPNLCVGPPMLRELDAVAVRRFARAGRRSSLVSLAGRFEGGAVAALAAYRVQVDRCDGTEVAFSAEERPGLGDEAIAVTIVGGEAPGAFWLARVDDAILGVSVSLGSGETPLDGEALLRIMVDRAG